MTCERCDYADLKQRGKNRFLYHLKYHHAISNLWWEPRFWILCTRDFLFWWALRDYFGKIQWHLLNLEQLRKDWVFTVDMRKYLG